MFSNFMLNFLGDILNFKSATEHRHFVENHQMNISAKFIR